MHFVCSISGNPATCVQEVTSAFLAHPNRTLLSPRLVFGLDTLSTPLAGVTRFSLGRYVVLDTIAAGIYSSCYLAAGCLFSSQLDRVVGYLLRFGRFAAMLAGVCRSSRLSPHKTRCDPPLLKGRVVDCFLKCTLNGHEWFSPID